MLHHAIGYLLGSLLGGVAIAAGGLGLLAVVYGALFLAATLPVRLRAQAVPCSRERGRLRQSPVRTKAAIMGQR